uniref:serine hydrolase domain-containing protein n=1 Tax=Streptomyces sp. NBRC 110028 TaxID=1621260 RepID=UPI000B3090BC
MHVPLGHRRGLLALTSLAAVLLTASTGVTAAAKPQQAGPLQQQVNAIHDTGAVGVLAEVTSPDTRDSARAGTAERGTKRPMPRNGRFRIGSAAKTFTATVVLQLVGERRMALEDTVERWLPGMVQGHGNHGSKITVRQLLQHTSGIRDVRPEIPAMNSADGYRAERFRTYTPKELVRLAMRHPPKFPPGTDW